MKTVRILVVSLAVVGALVIIAGIVFVYRPARSGMARVSSGPADLRRQLLLAHQEGIPTTPAELQAPLPPDSQNAALVWRTITREGRSKHHSFIDPEETVLEERVGKSGSYNRQDLPAVQRYLQSHSQELSLVHQAVSRAYCVFQRDWSQGPSLLLPEYAYMREGARLLMYESAALAMQSRYVEALRNQALGLRLADQVGSDPTGIAYHVEAACEQICLRGLARILLTAGPNAGVDNLARQLVVEGSPHYSLQRAMAGEINMAMVSTQIMDRAARTKGWSAALAVMGGLSGSGPQASPGSQPVNLPSDPGGRKFAHEWVSEGAAEMLQEYRRFYRAAALPPPARLRFFEVEGKKLIRKVEGGNAIASFTDPELILGAIFYPLLDQLAEREMIAREEEEGLDAGAAVLAYRAEHGKFPVQLSEAISPVPVNPFTLKPIQYRRTAGGFEVYDPSKATSRTANQYGSFEYP